MGESGDPVFVPEEVEDFRVEGGFKVGDIEGVVLIRVDAKVFYFVEGDGLVFGGFGVGGDVFLGVRSECSDVDFSGRHCSMWINLITKLAHKIQQHGGEKRGKGTGGYDYSNPWILKLLVLKLCGDINPR